jgi:hypothetical protein
VLIPLNGVVSITAAEREWHGVSPFPRYGEFDLRLRTSSTTEAVTVSGTLRGHINDIFGLSPVGSGTPRTVTVGAGSTAILTGSFIPVEAPAPVYVQGTVVGPVVLQESGRTYTCQGVSVSIIGPVATFPG